MRPESSPSLPQAADTALWAGVDEFNRGAYFRSHETWEAAWKVASPPMRPLLRGLILVAAACLKLQVGAVRPATRLLERAAVEFAALPPRLAGYEVAVTRSLVATWQERAARAPSGEPWAVAALPCLPLLRE